MHDVPRTGGFEYVSDWRVAIGTEVFLCFPQAPFMLGCFSLSPVRQPTCCGLLQLDRLGMKSGYSCSTRLTHLRGEKVA